MKRRAAKSSRVARLPENLRRFFWDCRFGSLRWEAHREFIIGRILSVGDWEAVSWLRTRVGESELKAWMLNDQGRELSPQQLRFWELILDLPRGQVDKWLSAPERQVWDQRARR